MNILSKLLNKEEISVYELLILLENLNINIGPRTKGYLNSYIPYIEYAGENEFYIYTNHPDYNNESEDFNFPNGIQVLFNDLYKYIEENK